MGVRFVLPVCDSRGKSEMRLSRDNSVILIAFVEYRSTKFYDERISSILKI